MHEALTDRPMSNDEEGLTCIYEVYLLVEGSTEVEDR